MSWSYREALREILESFCKNFEAFYWEIFVQELSGEFLLCLFDFLSPIVKLAHPMEVDLRPIHVILICLWYFFLSFFFLSPSTSGIEAQQLKSEPDYRRQVVPDDPTEMVLIKIGDGQDKYN